MALVHSGPTDAGLKKHGPLLACLLTLAVAAQTRADLIVQQPLQPTFTGAFSNLGPSNQQIADNFQLSETTTLESLSWFGRYDGVLSVTNPVAFSIRFFASAGVVPAVVPLLELNLAVDALPTGLTFGTLPWFSYSVSLPALTLDAGTYWVSVVESDSQTPTFAGSQWLWGHSNTSGVSALRFSDGAPWNPGAQNHAFSLTGTVVPEPSAWLLCALGTLGVLSMAETPVWSARFPV